jgi:hypothetical protein
MPDAGEAGFAAGGTNPILKNQVTTINAYCDPVPEKGYDSVSRHCFAGIAGLVKLIYGLHSCHGAYPSLVVRACRLLSTGGKPALF